MKTTTARRTMLQSPVYIFVASLMATTVMAFQTAPLVGLAVPCSKSATRNCCPDRTWPSTAAASSRVLQSQRHEPKKNHCLWLSNSNSDYDNDNNVPYFKGDSLVYDTSRALKRTSWLSWWAQVILTTVSSVTLLFARNVIKTTMQQPSTPSGFFLAGSGIVASFLSIFWTWGGARLANRLVNKEATNRIGAANMLRRAVKVAVYINIVGILLTVLGAEQIVGGLAIKVLSMQGVITGGPGYGNVATQTLQPLDILVVQANTNTLLSHFSALVLALWLTKYIDQLDPPSVENDERKRK